jgi:hypothetical protein
MLCAMYVFFFFELMFPKHVLIFRASSYALEARWILKSHFLPVLTYVNLGTFNLVKTCKNLYKTHVVLKQDTERLSFWGAWN